MNAASLPVLVGLGCVALASCGWLGLGKKPTAAAPDDTPTLVGRIASIPADRRFVLIQSYGPWHVPAGSVLVTRGADERSANLLATGESLGQFAAADLQAGAVKVGDAVLLLPAIAKKSPQKNPAPPTPAPETPPNRNP